MQMRLTQATFKDVRYNGIEGCRSLLLVGKTLTLPRGDSFRAAARALLFSLVCAAPWHGHAAAGVGTARTILVYGDSLSAAYGLKPEQGWVALLSNKLAGEPKTAAIRVVNASISGETTSGGRARIRADLAQHKPNIVIVALGANDGLRGLAVSDTRANLAAMLDAVRDSKARAVIVGIQIPPNYGIEYARDFRELFPTLARERKLALVPFLLDGIADKLELFQADRLHPVAAAQPRILQNVWSTLQPLLSTTKATVLPKKPA